MRDSRVNIAPPLTLARDSALPPLWEPWMGEEWATGSFHHAMADGSPVLRIAAFSGRPAWRSVPRKIEPRRVYRLEAAIRGQGRIGLQWVRIGRTWTSLREGLWQPAETLLGQAFSAEAGDLGWEDAAVGGVAPREATHCRIVLEASGFVPATDFREVYIDGLGIDPLEIHYCHAGYHPDGLKTVVVEVASGADAGSFSLIDESGKEVFEEELGAIEKGGWGRLFWLADFSTFHREGSFALVAQIGGRRRRTKFFPIRKDTYARLPVLTMGWLHAQRCGIGVAGWHGACHTDDGAVRTGEAAGTWRDAAGGWHTGADYAKDTDLLWIAIHALTHLYEKAGGRGFTFGGELPDALEEARWGAAYLLKLETGDGRYAAWVRPDPARAFYGPPEEETDNAAESGDERGIGPPCDWATAALSSYSLANYARVVEQMHPALAKKCFEAAERTFRAIERSRRPDDTLELHSAAALLCIGLWRAKGEEKYREECSWRILSVLQHQADAGTLVETPADEGGAHPPGEAARPRPLPERVTLPEMVDDATGMRYAPVPFLYLHALICYLERAIDDALSLEIRGALDKFFVRMKECAGVSPFGQMGEWTLADDPVSFLAMPRGLNAYYLACAYLLAKASVLLDRTDLGNMAERQLEWVLGRNIRSTCMVCGAGHKELGACYTKLAAVPAHADGFQLGGVACGIVGGDGRDYPVDFPCLDVRSGGSPGGRIGLDADPRTNECWLPAAAWFVLACDEVTRMLAARGEA